MKRRDLIKKAALLIAALAAPVLAKPSGSKEWRSLSIRDVGDGVYSCLYKARIGVDLAKDANALDIMIKQLMQRFQLIFSEPIDIDVVYLASGHKSDDPMLQPAYLGWKTIPHSKSTYEAIEEKLRDAVAA